MEIKANLNKPYVKLDKEKCTLTFKGKSYPEHAKDFYEQFGFARLSNSSSRLFLPLKSF